MSLFVGCNGYSSPGQVKSGNQYPEKVMFCSDGKIKFDVKYVFWKSLGSRHIKYGEHVIFFQCSVETNIINHCTDYDSQIIYI